MSTAPKPVWQLLDSIQTNKFIEEVRDADFLPLFEGPAYELWKKNLPFFDGYAHYSLANKAMIPYFTLDYISNGADHFYLDGSEHPLEILVRHEALQLDYDNVLDYIAFHSDVAFYPRRKVKFITDPSHTPYGGASAMAHHFKTLKYQADMRVSENVEEGCFYVDMPLLHEGRTIDGHVQVMKTGQINILQPVFVPLMDRKRDHAPLHYSHPYEQRLLEENLAVLTQSAEGKRLLETVESYGGQIKIMSGTGGSGFAPGSTLGYVVAPQNVETYSPYQVIAIAGVLRHMEQHLMGLPRPDPSAPLNELLEKNCVLDLDILLKICTIIDELSAAGYDTILTKFKQSGFEDIYSAYKNKRPEKELARIFADYLGVGYVEE